MESWALHVDDVGSSFIAGSLGGLRFTNEEVRGRNWPAPGLKYITTKDERDIDIDLRVNDYENNFYEKKLDPDMQYYDNNFEHWIAYLTGKIDERINTPLITLNTAFLSEGIFLSSELRREIRAEEIEALSESIALTSQETPWGTFEYEL